MEFADILRKASEDMSQTWRNSPVYKDAKHANLVHALVVLMDAVRVELEAKPGAKPTQSIRGIQAALQNFDEYFCKPTNKN